MYFKPHGSARSTDYFQKYEESTDHHPSPMLREVINLTRSAMYDSNTTDGRYTKAVRHLGDLKRKAAGSNCEEEMGITESDWLLQAPLAYAESAQEVVIDHDGTTYSLPALDSLKRDGKHETDWVHVVEAPSDNFVDRVAAELSQRPDTNVLHIKTNQTPTHSLVVFSRLLEFLSGNRVPPVIANTVMPPALEASVSQRCGGSVLSDVNEWHAAESTAAQRNNHLYFFN